MTAVIKSLQEFVTPHILDVVKSYEGSDESKSGVLNTLYGLVCAKLTDKIAYGRVAQLEAVELENGISLFDALFDDEIGTNVDSGAEQDTFLGKLYHTLSEQFNLPLSTVSALFLSALPLIYKHITSLVGSKTVPEYLDGERDGLFSSLPAWLLAIAPFGFLKAHAATTPAGTAIPTNPMTTSTSTPEPISAPVNPIVEQASVSPEPAHVTTTPAAATTSTTNDPKEGGGFLKGLLPIIGLIILAGLAWLMLKSCQKSPAPVATPTAQVANTDTAALAPATLDLKLNDKGDALASCTAKVGTLTFGEKLRTGIAKVFGADSCQLTESKDTDVQMPAEQYLPQVLGFMKGVPNASLNATDKTITLGSTDAAALEKLVSDVKTALPVDFTVTSGAGADGSLATLAPATLALALNDKGDAIASCDSTVGTGLGDKVRSLIAGVFGADKCTFNEDAKTDGSLAVEPHLPKILELMKGLPNATLDVSGNTLSFGSSDKAALDKLLADVKGVVPADFVVQAKPVLNESETVAKAIEASNQAIDSLGDNASLDDLLKALNLQIINFATSSSEIPAENKAILDKAAAHIKKLPEAHLVITGHTDNRGSAELNKKLSESRAKAVHDYLVSKGVDDAKLEVKGAGLEQPIANNDTEEGRFKNRRIEFTLMNNGNTVINTDKANEAKPEGK